MYSIVYIYLINSRLDVTSSVPHHFRTTYKLYHGVRLVVIQGGIYSDRTHTTQQIQGGIYTSIAFQIYTRIAFQEAF